MTSSKENKGFGEKFSIIIGAVLFIVFVTGLAWSISTGLAGFFRSIPFWIIVLFCISLLAYDSYQGIKKR
tara:strand:- start:692 stop:901 length:210 start_codon:yes stop_codon:yes gene_type:complete